jgi:hypothetical protein
MADLIGTIFHISDMHLFVDQDGDMRHDAVASARLIARLARTRNVSKLQRLFSGIMWHNHAALTALVGQIDQLVEAERAQSVGPTAPIVILQGGDVEALGSSAPSPLIGYDAFPSFAFVHQRLCPSDPRWGWSDIFGNHDTWPGTFPLIGWGHRDSNRDRVGTVPGVEGPWADAVELAPVSRVPVVVARLNTVSRTLVAETFASGELSNHPYDGAACEAALDRLRAALEPWRSRAAARVLLMHHPPSAPAGSAGAGKLADADKLAACLADLHVQLVVAGHVHELDPRRDASANPAVAQEPLVYPTMQLVAESPTQDSIHRVEDGDGYANLETRSFCRYRLWAAAEGLDVERTVFRYVGADNAFRAATARMVFGGLPLT